MNHWKTVDLLRITTPRRENDIVCCITLDIKEDGKLLFILSHGKGKEVQFETDVGYWENSILREDIARQMVELKWAQDIKRSHYLLHTAVDKLKIIERELRKEWIKEHDTD